MYPPRRRRQRTRDNPPKHVLTFDDLDDLFDGAKSVTETRSPSLNTTSRGSVSRRSGFAVKADNQ